MDEFTVTIGQLALAGAQAVYNQIHKTCTENPHTDLFVFPEFATQEGIDLHAVPYLQSDAEAQETARKWLGLAPDFSAVQSLSDGLNKAVLTGCLAQENGRLLSRAYFYDPQRGQLASYDKTHVHWTEGFLRPGTRIEPVHTRFGTIGLLICYDMAFAEATRVLGVQGTEVLFALSAVPLDFHWRYGHRRMIGAAVFSQYYVIAANLGYAPDAPMGGHSGIYGPEGDVVARIDGTGFADVSAKVDLRRVRHWREKERVNPYRQPHLYEALTAPMDSTQNNA
jgi:predicted amidohydrolase